MFLIFGGFYLLYIIFNFKKINMAIGIIKQAARCTQVLTQLRIVPIIVTLIILFFGGIVIFIVIYALSCGDIIVVPAQSTKKFFFIFCVVGIWKLNEKKNYRHWWWEGKSFGIHNLFAMAVDLRLLHVNLLGLRIAHFLRFNNKLRYLYMVFHKAQRDSRCNNKFI